jgi:hypothetical protein
MYVTGERQMLDVTDKTQQREASQSAAVTDTLSDLLDCSKQALVQWLRGTQAFSDEVLGIARARQLLTIEAWSALLACRSPEQVVEQQRRFIAKTMERGAEELTSLSQLVLKPPPSEPPK